MDMTRKQAEVTLQQVQLPTSALLGDADSGARTLARMLDCAKVALSDKDGGTLLSYDVEAQIGGKLAQLGQRLINSAAKKTADDFFVKFAAAVAPK